MIKGFSVVNEADVFLEFSCFSYDPTDVGNLISGSSPFSKSSLNIWKFSIHILLKPGLENFEHYFTSVWDECNCAIVWTFFGTALLWDWKENRPFPFLWPLLSFPNLLAYWVQHFNSIIFQDLKPRSPALQADSLPEYRFHKRQVRWSGIPITLRIFHSLLSSQSN